MKTPSPEMDLMTFLVGVYIPGRRVERKKGLTKKRIKNLLNTVGRVCVEWEDSPAMGAMTLAAINEYLTQAKAAKASERWLREAKFMLVAILRYAMDCNITPPDREAQRWLRACGQENRVDDDSETATENLGEPGTLWHYCQTEYFRLNIKIIHANTRMQYRIALSDLGEFLGDVPTQAHLNDDNVAGMMRMLLERGLARKTVNERRARINALWNWLAKRRLCESFPTTPKVKEQKRIPRAWSKDDLRRLFIACEAQPGFVGQVPAGKWWLGLHYVLWDSGARMGELLALRWEWLDLDTGIIAMPAEVRKGQDQDMLYRLHPRTVEVLRAIQKPERQLVFPWPKNPAYIYAKYKAILKEAGLSQGPKDMFHKMRRSVASHVQAAGVDASMVLAHSSHEMTRASYLDPSIATTQGPSDVLFDPRERKVAK